VTGTGLRWFRRANSGQYYPWGYEDGLTVDLIGAKQATSTQASLALSGTPTVEFSGGPFTAVVSQLLGTSTKGFLSTDKATSLSFSTTGLMTGSYTPAGTAAKHVIKGIIVSKPGPPGQAYGHILDPRPRPHQRHRPRRQGRGETVIASQHDIIASVGSPIAGDDIQKQEKRSCFAGPHPGHGRRLRPKT